MTYERSLISLEKPQMERLKAKFETAKTKIESKDEAQIKTLSGHDVTGVVFQAIVQNYFSINDIQDEVLERQSGVFCNSFMSFGTFSNNIQGIYSWGVLRSVQFAGMVMDIDRIGATLVDKDNKQSNLLAFTQQQGPRQSLNENQIPEMFFNDPNSVQKNVEGVSATKILKLANDQGQKIYQIDQSNINTILPQISHSNQVITDISNAVSSGKVVAISEKSINFKGWEGSGYIITDPNTGSGAYMISGGLNGGFLDGLTFDWKIFGLVALTGILLVLALYLPMIIAALAFFAAIGTAGCLIGYLTGDSDHASQGIYTAQFLSIFYLSFLFSKAENLTPQGMARITMAVAALDYSLSTAFNYADLDEWCAAQ